jgi:hypothetical protein
MGCKSDSAHELVYSHRLEKHELEDAERRKELAECKAVQGKKAVKDILRQPGGRWSIARFVAFTGNKLLP